MDPLRISLLIVGAALIVGLYAYDWWRRRGEGRGSMREWLRRHREPPARDEVAPEEVRQSLDELSEWIQEGRPAAQRGAEASGGKRERLVVMYVMARPDDRFRGPDILTAAEIVGLRHGARQIFHRTSEDGRTLFSMANLVEPGVFVLEEMERFTTRGLCLFAVLTPRMDCVGVFDEMLAAAQRLAAELGGELRDETRSALSRQRAQHLREEIREFQRRANLLRQAS